MQYTKAALSIPDQVNRWRAKGLVITDQAAAERALTFVGYFRLRGYALPFMQSTPTGRQFNSGTTFEQITELCEFDRELRVLILRELERIEVAVRTVISNSLSMSHGPFWYFNHPTQVLGHITVQGNKKVAFDIGGFLHDIERETQRSSDVFAKHYFDKYTDPLLPPSWLAAECLSFGKWSRLYRHLTHGRSPIARQFQLPVDVFESWLHALTILRNTCAHHARVWNRRFSIRPKVLNQWSTHFSNQQSIYCYLAVIQLFNRAIDGNCPFASDLQALLNRYPQLSLSTMGFPTGWSNDPLWR